MVITQMPGENVPKTKMQDDKQIYAYSWQNDLIKKVKAYFNRQKGSNETKVVTETPEPSKVFKESSVVSVTDIKINSKKERPVKPKAQKKQKNEDYQSPLLRKERQEKVLTYFIVSGVVLIFVTGVLLANGVINLQMLSGKQSQNTISSSTPTITPIPTTESITNKPNFTQTPVPTAVRKSVNISPPTTNCKVSGCNGEICADESLGEISSICLYQEKYACYKNGVCERQSDGRCAWTENQELKACLNNYQ